jgi:hypothetical protein
MELAASRLETLGAEFFLAITKLFTFDEQIIYKIAPTGQAGSFLDDLEFAP